jgi:predicted dinucleotide-binding enzyme
MRVGIIGTGPVGRAFGRALTDLGHQVVVGTRDPAETRERAEWSDSPLELVAYAALASEVFLNATGGDGALPALAAVGAALDGHVVIDVSNPLDFSRGFPPSLSVCNTDSLAEQLQRAHPAARIVKMFNTTANEVMVNPQRLGQESTLFVAGNDEGARSTATDLARELGWTDILDLGDLTGARGLEMWLPLWVRIYQQLGTPEFNLKIVRSS